MIVGHKDHWESERAYAHPVIRQAIDYLVATDFTELVTGQYTIRGEDMFARVIELTTKDKHDQLAEKHEQFFDIHYLIEGEERIGWSIQDDKLVPTEPYNPEHDASLYDDIPAEMQVDLTPGMYVVLFPEDIHRPGLTAQAPGTVRKVVVKINTDLFKTS